MQPRAERVAESRGQRLFFGFFLPLGVLANLVLGLLILTDLKLATWSDWLQVATGALCCVIAGWLAAVSFSKLFWYRRMAHQIATWRRIADAFFAWVEDVPVPAEALHRLRSSLEEAVPSSEPRY